MVFNLNDWRGLWARMTILWCAGWTSQKSEDNKSRRLYKEWGENNDHRVTRGHSRERSGTSTWLCTYTRSSLDDIKTLQHFYNLRVFLDPFYSNNTWELKYLWILYPAGNKLVSGASLLDLVVRKIINTVRNSKDLIETGLSCYNKYFQQDLK